MSLVDSIKTLYLF